MGARIEIDMARVRPVIDGHWHMTYARRVPAPGEMITTLCGRTEPAEYEDRGTQRQASKTCWQCDLVYRRDHGIPWAGEGRHPALEQ